MNLTMLNEAATKSYKTPIFASERFYCMLSVRAKERCRLVDRIQGGSIRTGLYTFDVNPAKIADPRPPPASLGQLVPVE